MAHIRSIKPDFFTDPDLIALGDGVRLLFIGLWTQADRDGRLEDDPRSLKLRLFPDQKVDIEARLQALSPRHIIRYTCDDGRKYIQVRNFLKHQRPHPSEADSIIPSPTIEIPVSYQIDTSQQTVKTLLREGKGREGKGREGNGHDTSDSEKSEFGPEELVSLWNSSVNGKLPLVEKISKERLAKARARLSEHSERTWWVQVIERICQSNFLTGQRTDWRASFDWLLANDRNALKVLEGNYDNNKKQAPAFVATTL